MASIDLGIYQIEHNAGEIACLQDGAVIDSARAEDVLVRRTARCLSFPKIGMSVSLSESEWDALVAAPVVEAPVEEAAPEAVSEEVAVEAAPEVAAPVVSSRRGRRKA